MRPYGVEHNSWLVSKDFFFFFFFLFSIAMRDPSHRQIHMASRIEEQDMHGFQPAINRNEAPTEGCDAMAENKLNS